MDHTMLAFEEKISKPTWFDFGEWLIEHPQAIENIHALMTVQGPVEHLQNMGALWAWIELHAPGSFELGYDHARHDRTGELVVGMRMQPSLGVWHMSSVAVESMTYLPAGNFPPDWTLPVENPSEHLLVQALRSWFESQPDAPVLVARFQGQHSEEENDNIINDDEAVWSWDATADWLGMDMATQRGAMESDSYDSDAFREGPCAPTQASQWDGPFAISTRFHAPSKAFIALRQAAKLQDDTLLASATKTRLRL